MEDVRGGACVYTLAGLVLSGEVKLVEHAAYLCATLTSLLLKLLCVHKGIFAAAAGLLPAPSFYMEFAFENHIYIDNQHLPH